MVKGAFARVKLISSRIIEPPDRVRATGNLSANPNRQPDGLEIRGELALHDGAMAALLLNQLRDQTRPAGLVIRPQARPGLTVKILVEEIALAIRTP